MRRARPGLRGTWLRSGRDGPTAWRRTFPRRLHGARAPAVPAGTRGLRWPPSSLRGCPPHARSQRGGPAAGSPGGRPVLLWLEVGFPFDARRLPSSGPRSCPDRGRLVGSRCRGSGAGPSRGLGSATWRRGVRTAGRGPGVRPSPRAVVAPERGPAGSREYPLELGPGSGVWEIWGPGSCLTCSGRAAPAQCAESRVVTGSGLWTLCFPDGHVEFSEASVHRALGAVGQPHFPSTACMTPSSPDCSLARLLLGTVVGLSRAQDSK